MRVVGIEQKAKSQPTNSLRTGGFGNDVPYLIVVETNHLGFGRWTTCIFSADENGQIQVYLDRKCCHHEHTYFAVVFVEHVSRAKEGSSFFVFATKNASPWQSR